MGKLTAEQQRQLDELTAIANAPDDGDDDAVWVRNGDGHETRLTGARAQAWLARNGYSDAAGDASTEGNPLPPKDGKTPVKKAAKKAAPPAPGAPADGGAAGGEGDELPTDAAPENGRR